MNTLKTSIASLYEVFAAYPYRPAMESCSCCVKDSHRATLGAKSLQKLEEEDLSHYAAKAMTTRGEVEDFKHYLPRICELASTPDGAIPFLTVLDKLEYGAWKTWPEKEQAAVRIFLLAWWEQRINTPALLSTIDLLEFYHITGDMQALLERWSTAIGTQGFRNLIDFLNTDYNNLVHGQGEFRDMDPTAKTTLIRWVNSLAPLLEEGFFQYDSRKDIFAEKISTALSIFDTLNRK